MNLLMISGDRSLAAGKHAAFYNTLEELHKHFDRIDIICPKSSVRRYNMSVFGNVFVHPSPLPLVFQWLWIFLKGRSLVRAHDISLITCHEYPPFYNGFGAWLLHKATSIRYMLEVMHIPGYPRAFGLRERFYRWFMKAFIALDARPAMAVRVINKQQTPEFLAEAGVPRQKLLYVPAFYIDQETFHPADLPKQYDLIFVGRLVQNKGLGLFLDVLAKTGLIGIVVGEGPLLRAARRRAKRQGLKVHFAGFASDSAAVARHLNESRILLMPSYNEGGPRVVLEAMACGVPVVATPVGIVPDVLPPECIEEWHPADLADKVRNILGDEALYARLRENGIAMAQQFERKATIATYAEAIKKLAPHA